MTSTLMPPLNGTPEMVMADENDDDKPELIIPASVPNYRSGRPEDFWESQPSPQPAGWTADFATILPFTRDARRLFNSDAEIGFPWSLLAGRRRIQIGQSEACQVITSPFIFKPKPGDSPRPHEGSYLNTPFPPKSRALYEPHAPGVLFELRFDLDARIPLLVNRSGLAMDVNANCYHILLLPSQACPLLPTTIVRFRVASDCSFRITCPDYIRTTDEVFESFFIEKYLPSLQLEMISMPRSHERVAAQWTSPYGFLDLDDDYVLTRELGMGSLGPCYLAWSRISAKFIVTRRIKREKKELWAPLRHEHLMPLLGSFVHLGNPYMITPFYPIGDLFDLLEMPAERWPLSRSSLFKAVVSQMCHALHYLDFRRLVHCNIQPQAILIKSMSNGSAQFVLGDFREMRAKGHYDPASLHYTAGYEGPEYLSQQPILFDEMIDIFSLGVVGLNILGCWSYFGGRVKAGEDRLIWLEDQLEKVPDRHAAIMVREMLDEYAQSRPSPEELLKNPYLKHEAQSPDNEFLTHNSGIKEITEGWKGLDLGDPTEPGSLYAKPS